jgi:hypothetical protein
MEEEKTTNTRFYILLLVLIILSLIVSYFNYKMNNGIIIPTLYNSTYESILKHTGLLKKSKNLLKKK